MTRTAPWGGCFDEIAIRLGDVAAAEAACVQLAPYEDVLGSMGAVAHAGAQGSG